MQPLTNHAFSAPKPQPIVTVRNELQGGRDLFLHCNSAHEDLGVQHLHPLGNFSWSFEINFFRTTLFHCSFQWESVLHRFDIYTTKRDSYRCFICTWVVREDGPCLSFDKGECSLE